MAPRIITAEDLTTLSWIEIPPLELGRVGWTDTDTGTGMGWWRIIAEISCSTCGASQAADSDPTNNKEVATTLALALFNDAGWRVDTRSRVVCGECAQKYGLDT